MLNYYIKVPITIFHHEVVLIYADSLEDCSKIARESYSLDANYDSAWLAVTEKHGNITTILLPKDVYEKDSSVLVHETNHAAFNVVNYIGARISNDTEEVICYLQQYIYKECKKFLDTIPTDALNSSE